MKNHMAIYLIEVIQSQLLMTATGLWVTMTIIGFEDVVVFHQVVGDLSLVYYIKINYVPRIVM